jgi:predicted Zn-dependent protease
VFREVRILLITIALLGGVVLNLPVNAANTISAEEEQQFRYYFYEAQRLIQKQEIAPAWELVQFCYALNPNDAAINNYMGMFLEVFDKKKEADTYFKRAFELDPNTYWYQHALYLLKSEDKKQEKIAIRNLEKVAKANTKNEDVHTMLQQAYIHVKDYKRALGVQDCLDSIVGYTSMSAMQRYRLNAMMKNSKQAIYEVERFLEEEPDNMQFQVFRAQLYEETHQPSEKMIVAYTALLRFDPRNLMLQNNLAWHLCISRHDLQRAEQLSRTTIMSEPSNPIYLDTYAWIMYMMGEYETAYFYIQRAMEYANQQTIKEVTEHRKAILKKLK